MSYHQIKLRKDGPTHAVEYARGGYAFVTRCGMYISTLNTPVRRLFPPADQIPCKRCLTSTR